MSVLAAIGIIVVLNILFNLLILATGVNSSFHQAIKQQGSLFQPLVYLPAIFFVSRYVYKHYKKSETAVSDNAKIEKSEQGGKPDP